MKPEQVSSPDWKVLVAQLLDKTLRGSLVWEEGTAAELIGRDGLVRRLAPPGARFYRAKVMATIYELSKGKQTLGPVYELKIWERTQNGLSAVAALNSRVSSIRAMDSELARLIESLYHEVDSTVEAEDETVARLLSDLDDLN